MSIVRLFLSVIVFLVLATVGAYAAAQKGIISPDQIAKVPGLAQVLSRPELSQVMTQSESGLKVLSSATQKSASDAGQVLGSQVQVGEQPLPQRAFEFARYSYCQEVVKDYETRFPAEE